MERGQPASVGLRTARIMERRTGWSVGTSALDVLRAGRRFVVERAEQLDSGHRRRLSISFGAAVLDAYWLALQTRYATSSPLCRPCADLTTDRLPEDVRWLAAMIGRAAATVEPVTAGFYIGTTYAATLPDDVRARFGVYYTPPAIAARLLDQATVAGVDWATCRVLDPACGGGAFLAPVAQRILKRLSHLEPDDLVANIEARVRGFEIDPVAAWMSQTFLEAVLLPVSRLANRRVSNVVEVRDSLIYPPAELFDLVIGNPPYARVTLPPALRARYSDSLYGHANLYGLFTELALRMVADKGVVAYVTPTSFLAGEYFKKLRYRLGTQAPPMTVDFLHSRKNVFDGVLQEALLSTYRRGARAVAVPVSLLTPVDDSSLGVESIATFTVPERPEEPWPIPRSASQARLILRMRGMRHRLSDWGYTVSTGPLVWNRHKDQLRNERSVGCSPIVWAEAVAADGRFILRADKANHMKYFKPRVGDDWLIARQSCILLQRTTAKEQRRRLIAAVLPGAIVKRYGGVVVENHLNMIRPLRASPPVSPRVIAAFFNSTVADEAFRCLSGSVAVSAYEIESLPLPAPDRLIELEQGVARRLTGTDLDEICARLYGLSE